MKLTNDARAKIVRSVMAAIPIIDYDKQMRARAVEIGLSLLPPDIVKLYHNADKKRYIREGVYYYCCINLAVPGFNNYEEEVRNALKNDVALSEIHALRDAQKATRNKLEADLRGNLAACSTDKQFRDRFPDLSAYLPSINPIAANVPATTALIDSLKAAGLPMAQECV